MRRIVNVTIDGSFGVYYGECQLINNQWTPQGRGIFDCFDILILGYVRDGYWAFGSDRIVVNKVANIFSTQRAVQLRSGRIVYFHRSYSQNGLYAEGLWDGFQQQAFKLNFELDSFMGISGRCLIGAKTK